MLMALTLFMCTLMLVSRLPLAKFFDAERATALLMHARPPLITDRTAHKFDSATQVLLRKGNFSLSSLKAIWHMSKSARVHNDYYSESDKECDEWENRTGAFYFLANPNVDMHMLRVRLIGPVVMALRPLRTSRLPEAAPDHMWKQASDTSDVDIYEAWYYLPFPGRYNLSIIATYMDIEMDSAFSDLQIMKSICPIPAPWNEQVFPQSYSVSFSSTCVQQDIFKAVEDRLGFVQHYGKWNRIAKDLSMRSLLSVYLPTIFWRVDPALLGHIAKGTVGAVLKPNAPQAHYAFSDGQLLDRVCCRDHLLASEANVGYICFVGDSHMRYLYNDIALSLFGGVDGNVALNKEARNESHFRFYNLHFASDVDGNLRAIQETCSTLFVNFGQWPLGWPQGRPLTVSEFASDVEQVLAKLKTALASPLGSESEVQKLRKMYWLFQEPCPETGVFQCPARDWRSHAWTRAYNKQAARTAEAHAIDVIDVFSAYEAVQELTYDGCHYVSPVTGAAVDMVLQKLFPECGPDRG